MEAIPYGHALMIQRICSVDGKWLARSKNLVEWFADRSYERGFVREQIKRSWHLDR